MFATDPRFSHFRSSLDLDMAIETLRRYGEFPNNYPFESAKATIQKYIDEMTEEVRPLLLGLKSQTKHNHQKRLEYFGTERHKSIRSKLLRLWEEALCKAIGIKHEDSGFAFWRKHISSKTPSAEKLKIKDLKAKHVEFFNIHSVYVTEALQQRRLEQDSEAEPIDIVIDAVINMHGSRQEYGITQLGDNEIPYGLCVNAMFLVREIRLRIPLIHPKYILFTQHGGWIEQGREKRLKLDQIAEFLVKDDMLQSIEDGGNAYLTLWNPEEMCGPSRSCHNSLSKGSTSEIVHVSCSSDENSRSPSRTHFLTRFPDTGGIARMVEHERGGKRTRLWLAEDSVPDDVHGRPSQLRRRNNDADVSAAES